MHPHIESLNSIKVYPFGGQDLTIHHSFLDLIALYNVFEFSYSNIKLKACFFKDSELKEINPIYGFFKRIKDLYFINYEHALEQLYTLEQTSIREIEVLNFRKMNEEDFEQIANQLLDYKIHNLENFDCWDSISNQSLENISKINPQELHQLVL